MINTFFTETLPMNTRTRNLTRTSSNACENNTKTLHATYLRRTSSSILLTLFMGVMLLFFIQTSFAQTFSGGSGTQGDPYRISTPSDLVELSAITNVNDGIATVGQYFELTNNIDMASVSGFVPIGVTTQNPNRTTHYFCGNFDGKNFALKNLSIVDTVSFSQQNTALFGDVKGARITNLLLDNAFFSSKVRVSAFVGTAIDSLYMDNCIALSCTMEGNTISGFISSGVSSITNCRVVNAKMEGYTIMGFCGTAYSGTQISNSSVRYSTLIGEASVAGFATSVPSASNCYVSNCVLSGNYIGGFVYMTSNAEIDNCGVQAVLMKTTALSSASGFAWWCGGMGTTERISNSYDACEFTGIDNNHDYDYPFGAGAANGSTVILTNCYTKTDPNLPVGNYNSDVVSKSDSYLKSAAMVAHPGTLDNSLNYGQSSPAWKEDFSPHPINKGYPILAWVQPFSYVSTYPVTDLTSVSATLQGLTFAEGEGIIAEHGFQWREKGTGSWTTVIVQDTDFNVSYALAGLTKNVTYEYFVYMTTTTTQHGDTVEFTPTEGHTISGKITLKGSPLAGVTVSCTGYPAATTDAHGEYSVMVADRANVTLTPSLSGYSFTPPSISCTDVTDNLDNQDFTATSVDIVEIQRNASIRIYPNPTTGKLSVESDKVYKVESIEIYDVVGQRVGAYHIRPENTETVIDISHLANGLYFLKVDGKTVKIVKQ